MEMQGIKAQTGFLLHCDSDMRILLAAFSGRLNLNKQGIRDICPEVCCWNPPAIGKVIFPV